MSYNYIDEIAFAIMSRYMKPTLCSWGQSQVVHRGSSRTLSKYGNVIGIPTEFLDVLLDPS